MIDAIGEADLRDQLARALDFLGAVGRNQRWHGCVLDHRALRGAASAGAASSNGLRPSSVTVPLVGGSSAPSTYRSELLPLPDGPITAAASPGASVNETPARTVNGPRAVGYALVRSVT